MNAQVELIRSLHLREQYRDEYWEKRDPIADERLLWRAQSFRHKVHLLPKQTILELGCGKGYFTRQVLRVSRDENPITCVTFSPETERPPGLPHNVECISCATSFKKLEDRRFDFVVAIDLLDKGNCAWVMQKCYDLLNPGGQVLFYDSNPWNALLKVRRALSPLWGRKDPRSLLNRPELYELIAEIGFIRTSVVFNDFVFRPLPKSFMWMFRNLSTLLENAPGVRTLAGSILVHAQKPPRVVELPKVSLFEHEALRAAVSVVVPCHNEEMNIGPLVTRLRDLFGDYLHEIIPVDDNSRDGTRKVIERLATEDSRIKPVFRQPPNGVGLAIQDGYRAATGKYVLSMDCDFQHLLPEVRDIFDAAAQGYDVIVGSRFSRLSVLLNYPFPKILANRGFHLLARLVLLRGFRDLTNNLKFMKREVVDRLRLTQPGFAVNAETGLLPLMMGCSVKEVPISWINRTLDMGSSSFRLIRVGSGYGRVLWNIWLEGVLGIGPYKGLSKPGTSRNTY